MRIFSWIFWFLVAAVVHAAVLAFGGLLIPKAKESTGTTTPVDLVSDVADDAKKKDEKKPEEAKEKKDEDVETSNEKPPDAAEILRSLDTPLVDSAPALEAASLGAIEAALNGQGGGGDFADALTFASGGRIGGAGKVGEKSDKFENAFSMSEIDQKPSVVYQEQPVYPSEMRSKKVEGAVTAIFVVDANGKVQSPRVEKSSAAAFEAPALTALRKWKFDPGVRAGQRVSTKMRVTIRFPIPRN